MKTDTLVGWDEAKMFLQYSSRKNPAEFLKEVEELANQRLVQVFRSADGDAFDVLLTFGSALIFIDTKSREVLDEKKHDEASRKTWRTQAKDLTSVMKTTRHAWLYVYFTTHSVRLSGKANVLTIGTDLAERFFGPLWLPYRALRAESS